MRFVKMHGIGNDYVYVDAVSEPGIERRPDLPALARRISDRHTGGGGHGMRSGAIVVDGARLDFDLVSMGNPHAVISTGDSSRRSLDGVDVARLGRVVETHAAFPGGINVHWWEFQSHRMIRMRTWERG